jgi:putative ABC transport system ATP-binding protein
MTILSAHAAKYHYRKNSSGYSSGVGPLSFEIQTGDFIIITGGNGSGKSTLLKILDGSLDVQSGDIYLKGLSTSISPIRKRKKLIARVFQDPSTGTVSDLSILENFRLASLRGGNFSLLKLSGKKFRKSVIAYLQQLDRGFEDLIDQHAAELSGGQRQVLTVLMSLYCKPEVLLLDEPTAALDAAMAEILLEILTKANKEHQVTVLMISHDLRTAVETGNRLLIMKEGMLMREINGAEKQALSAEALFNILYPL